MTEPPSKKSKTENEKSKGCKCGYTKRHFLEVGQKGFLATCNFREKDCVRECYNVLGQYADELYGPEPKSSSAKVEEKPDKEETDISDDLQNEIDATKAAAGFGRSRRFQAVDTGTKNCVFIKTTLEDPVELATKLIKDIAEKKSKRTRYLLRLTPIQTVCKATVSEITKAGGPLFDKYFLKGDKTFAVVFNKRYNNEIKRDEVIKTLADLVIEKNVRNKVDLKNPDLSVITEIVKGKCCMSVVEGYFKYRKYNLVELGSSGPLKVENSDPTEKTEEKPAETSDDAKRKTTGDEPVQLHLLIGSKLKELLEGKKVNREVEPTPKKFKDESEERDEVDKKVKDASAEKME